jgi:hypothetical protein
VQLGEPHFLARRGLALAPSRRNALCFLAIALQSLALEASGLFGLLLFQQLQPPRLLHFALSLLLLLLLDLLPQLLPGACPRRELVAHMSILLWRRLPLSLLLLSGGRSRGTRSRALLLGAARRRFELSCESAECSRFTRKPLALQILRRRQVSRSRAPAAESAS